MKIEKIDMEMQKTREKITELQNKLKELDAQKTEQENLQIVQMVRSLRMSPQKLKEFLSGDTETQQDKYQTAAASVAASPYMTQEDSEDEE